MPNEDDVSEVRTYRDLLEALGRLTDEELDQLCQVARYNGCDAFVHEGQPVYCLGAVDQLGLRYFRSCSDNRRRGSQIVLMTDASPFGEDGHIGYELGGFFTDPPKKLYPGTFTPDQDWTGPAQKLADAASSTERQRAREARDKLMREESGAVGIGRPDGVTTERDSSPN